jgi:hypothetical protein
MIVILAYHSRYPIVRGAELPGLLKEVQKPKKPGKEGAYDALSERKSGKSSVQKHGKEQTYDYHPVSLSGRCSLRQ